MKITVLEENGNALKEEEVQVPEDEPREDRENQDRSSNQSKSHSRKSKSFQSSTSQKKFPYPILEEEGELLPQEEELGKKENLKSS